MILQLQDSEIHYLERMLDDLLEQYKWTMFNSIDATGIEDFDAEYYDNIQAVLTEIRIRIAQKHNT